MVGEWIDIYVDELVDVIVDEIVRWKCIWDVYNICSDDNRKEIFGGN